MSKSILEVQNLSVSYAQVGGHESLALDDISFAMPQGAHWGIAGETGAGKSTLARAVAALEPITHGRVLIDGTCVASCQRKDALKGEALRRARRKFQILFQDPGSSLSPRLTVETIIAEGALAHGLWTKSEVESRVGRALEQVNLSPKLSSRFPSELSGGERRRIALARVRVVRPALLILDEPTAGLDQENLKDLLSLLRGLAEQDGTSLLVISHDLSVVRELCHQVVVMRHGQVVESLGCQQFFQDPVSDYSKALIQAASGDSAWVE